MPTIIIRTQTELDALPSSLPEFTYIDIHSGPDVEITVAKAYGSAAVTAYGSAAVTAYGSATVTAYDSATVTAYDSATVRAYGSATVTACGSATVTAYDSGTTLTLLGFAVGVLFAKARVAKRGKNAVVVRQAPRPAKDLPEWVEFNLATKQRGKLILFKRVSKDFQTREGTDNETLWRPGSVVEHPDWSPKHQECGEGKYHACASPFFCDQYRSSVGDRYVAIEVAARDTYVWPHAQHPHKIAFRKGRVLYECDAMGKKLP